MFKKNNIQYSFHYPNPLHKLNSLKKFFYKQKYQNAENLAKNGISVPIDPLLKKKDIRKIVKIINSL